MKKQNHYVEVAEESTYEETLIGVFKNFCFSGYEPFVVPILPMQDDSDYLSSVFMHGCLYRQLCFILDRELSLNEYFEVFSTVAIRLDDDDLIYSFAGTDLVRIEDYYDGDRCGEYIYPLLGSCIERDMRLPACEIE